MGSKLKELYEHLTGIDPSELEPPLCGATLQKAIRYAKTDKNLRQHFEALFAKQNPVITGPIVIYHHKHRTKPDGFFVISAVFQSADGTEIGTYAAICLDLTLLRQQPEDYVGSIPKTDWFPYKPDEPSSSGV